jgi:hypothetical protein
MSTELLSWTNVGVTVQGQAYHHSTSRFCLDSFSILALSSSANFDYVEGSVAFLSSNSLSTFRSVATSTPVLGYVPGRPTLSSRKLGNALPLKRVFWHGVGRGGWGSDHDNFLI